MRVGTVAWAVMITALATNLAHAVAHVGQRVTLLPYWHWAYIVGAIYLVPVLAAVLLLARYFRAGAWLLVVSMAGALALGVAYRFLVPGLDNAFTLPAGGWWPPFRASAVLVALMSGAGFVAGVGVLRGGPSGGEGAAPAGSRPEIRRGPW